MSRRTGSGSQAFTKLERCNWNGERARPGRSEPRPRVVIVRTLKSANPSPQDEFWANPEDEVAVYVTNLEKDAARPEPIALLYAKRADTENVFDELKNQWGFRGYGSQRAVVTELRRGWSC